MQKKKEEEDKNKQKNEELLRQQEEKRLQYNDNVNYLNDFQCQDICNLTDIKHISDEKFDLKRQTVAVYAIIRNNERFYELACPKKMTKGSSEYPGIVIYNILSYHITNKIYKAHGSNENIDSLKHYYYSPSKKHFLLSSSNITIKLWNISSKIITKEMEIAVGDYNNNQYSNNCLCSCLLFDKENYYICRGGQSYTNSTYKGTITIFNKNENRKEISKSNLEQVDYIEATYIKDKTYILLSGNYHSESYDYNNDSLKVYKPKEIGKNESNSINIFKKNEEIYLINGYNGGTVIIFDFFSEEEIYSIKLGDSYIYGLCSLNEKYFLVGHQEEIKIIDFDNKTIIENNRSFDNDKIRGIKKIKIPEKGELIIGYTDTMIAFWK